MCVITAKAYSQEKINQSQLWVGYMTTIQVTKKYILWNDVHLVPSAFFIARTGLIWNIKKFNATAGYAYGRLPVDSTQNGLKRSEHRLWGQVQGVYTLPKNLVAIPRIRYDARFRQEVAQGELMDSYAFVNRIRFMFTLRKFLTPTETSIGKPFISLNDELLLNFGKRVTYNRFDQNRISLMVGTQHKSIQIQMGYMNRFVKTGADQFTENHTLIIWCTHKFNNKRLATKHNAEPDGE